MGTGGIGFENIFCKDHYCGGVEEKFSLSSVRRVFVRRVFATILARTHLIGEGN